MGPRTSTKRPLICVVLAILTFSTFAEKIPPSSRKATWVQMEVDPDYLPPAVCDTQMRDTGGGTLWAYGGCGRVACDQDEPYLLDTNARPLRWVRKTTVRYLCAAKVHVFVQAGDKPVARGGHMMTFHRGKRSVLDHCELMNVE